jgi:hypothetical protein
LATVGVGSTTVKLSGLVAVPPGVVTVTGPLVAPAGTTKVSVVASTMVKLLTGPPLSDTAVAPVRLVPVAVTVVPTSPLLGVKATSVGTGVGAGVGGATTGGVTVNVVAAEVPPPGAGLVTVTPNEPALATALAGTCAVSWVAEV